MSRRTKQKSIFEFSERKKTTSWIDLTDSPPPSAPSSEIILCPVCEVAMDKWEMNGRIQHVEECLSVTTIKQELISEPSSVLDSKDDLYETPSEPLKREHSTDSLQGVITKKKRTQPTKKDPKKDTDRYRNTEESEPKRRATKQSEPLTELLPSSRTKPIPQLKVMTFPVDSQNNYEIAVDAFSFKPHETISQYFLSHFHADHYGGITKRWPSERTLDSKIIYCSEITARLLQIRFKIDPQFIYSMLPDKRYLVKSYTEPLLESESSERLPGLYVTLIDANHCPGAVVFLFESIALDGKSTYMLHCGDFRASKTMMQHPSLQPFHIENEVPLKLEKIYLDTTYMSPKYNFPSQNLVCDTVATMFSDLCSNERLFSEWYGTHAQSRITDFLGLSSRTKKKKFLILVGTYLIGKEKLAIAILKKLGKCPIYISNINSRGDKKDIIKAYGNDYLDEVITSDDTGGDAPNAVVHLVPMKIVGSGQELANYFNYNKYFDHFEKCVGLRPTGWTFENHVTDENFVDAEDELPMVEAQKVSLVSCVNVLSLNPDFSYVRDVLSQNPPQKLNSKTKKMDSSTYKIYSLPYSEHSSFRDLSFFVVFLNTEKVIPTVNTENEWSVSRMNTILRQWEKIRLLRWKHVPIYDLPPPMVSKVKEIKLESF